MLTVTDDPRYHLPILDLPEPPNWARLPIAEGDEPLVRVEESTRLRVHAVYAAMNLPGAETTLLLRQGAYMRLRQAAESLPAGIALCLFDGFRPLSVQRHLYEGFWKEVAREHPTWDDDAIRAQVQQFVAVPNPNRDAPPPHRTGGAVDVYLVDTTTGVPLPMGTEADEISPRSVTGWYETQPTEPFTQNRRLLYHVLTAQGFTNYHGEWWHFDFGNQRWANVAGEASACYGIPVEDLS